MPLPLWNIPDPRFLVFNLQLLFSPGTCNNRPKGGIHRLLPAVHRFIDDASFQAG
jgi:hypothetical protein